MRLERALINQILSGLSMFGVTLLTAVGLVLVAYAIDPPDRIASHWMHQVMFDKTPWGEASFDKDWGKCPT